MSDITSQLETIRDIQNKVGSSHIADSPDTESPVAFVIELGTSRPLTGLRLDLEDKLQNIAFTLEVMHSNDEEPIFFILTIHDVQFNHLEGSHFTLSYYLLTVEGVISVDADMETDFHPWQASDSEQSGAFSAFKALCFTDKNDSAKPKDKGWALRATQVDLAWEAYGVTGKGVRLAQIDSGLAEHVEFDGRTIDNSLGINIYDPGKGAIDPLKKRFLGFDQLGHGTAVSSVIISQGGLDSLSTTAPGHITGVAKDVDFLPIRAIRSVIRIRQSKVTQAIEAAVNSGAHIISMSLGGIPSRALEAVLDRANRANVIVLAASGNCAPFVVFPAAYHNCIAVSGVTFTGEKWKGASVGREVDFTAPAEFVYHARRNSRKDIAPFEAINAGQGTSFAVAISAAIAALWLERFNRDSIIETLSPGESLMDRFRRQATRTVTTSPNWPTQKMGAGIINAFSLLTQEPYSPDPVGGGFSGKSMGTVRRPGGSSNAERVRRYLSGDINKGGFSVDRLHDGLLEACGQEIIYHMMSRYAHSKRDGNNETASAISQELASLQLIIPELKTFAFQAGE